MTDSSEPDYNSLYNMIDKYHLLAIIILAVSSLAVQNCTNNTDCPPSSTCGYGYCSCDSGFIFNCSTPASASPQSGYLIPLIIGQMNYYTLASQIDKILIYSVTLRDSNNINVLTTYRPAILIDQGINQTTGQDFQIDSVDNQYFVLSFQLQAQLTNKPYTQQPQTLVLVINPIAGITPSLRITYQYYQKPEFSNIFMLLAYISGGVFLVSTIVMTICLCKQNCRRQNQQQTSSQDKPDLSYFQELMPAKNANIHVLRQVKSCCICLQQYDFNSIVRKTVCKHVIHSQCLDQWCLKTLNCPMCRTDLSKQNIERMQAQQSQQNDQSSWIMNTLHQQQPIQMDSHVRSRLQQNASSIYNNHNL